MNRGCVSMSWRTILRLIIRNQRRENPPVLSGWIKAALKITKTKRELLGFMNSNRRLNQRISKMNFFLRGNLPLFSLFSSRMDQGPFFLLLNLPGSLFPLPVRSPIIPKMEIEIKSGGSDYAFLINKETNFLREN